MVADADAVLVVAAPDVNAKPEVENKMIKKDHDEEWLSYLFISGKWTLETTSGLRLSPRCSSGLLGKVGIILRQHLFDLSL